MHILKKGDFSRFAESMISEYDVIAPSRPDGSDREGIVRFKRLEKGDAESGKIIFEQPLYPAKGFFLPLREPFFHFRKGDVHEDLRERLQKKMVFMMHRCDINAAHRNDLILLEEPADPYYKEKRENSFLIELPCTQLERCKCMNFKLIDNYDLKIMDLGDGDDGNYVLDARTEKGKQLIKGLHLPEASQSQADKAMAGCIQEKGDAGPREIKEANKEVWEKYSKECLSCSACTVVCPTCTCFTIDGHMELNCLEGHRYREWASCQLLEFTRVAGGHVFRRERGSRGRQRLHCKFQYFREKFGHDRCVGCGRCNQACPVGINIAEYRGMLK